MDAPAPRLHLEFPALGTNVHVGTREPDDLDACVRVVVDVLAAVDVSLSRFRSDSELSAVNAASGRRTPAGPVLVAAVEAAVRAAEETDGLVNPLLGRSMVALGYDRTFAELRPVGHRCPRPDPDAWHRLEVGEDWVRVPCGTSLDLGSIGKAWAADLAAGTIMAQLGCDAIVSVGGDLAIAGDASWAVSVTERAGEPDGYLVHLQGGGLATSSTRVRRWSQEGVTRHHVLDPRTGYPAQEVWRTVSATGPTCVAANTAATAAIVLGHDARPWLAERAVDAMLVSADGEVAYVGHWPTDRGVAA